MLSGRNKIKIRKRIRIGRKKYFPEVNEIPENEKYIRTSKMMELCKPVLHRLAWFAALILFCVAPIPLTLKALINLFDAFFDRKSVKEAGLNLLFAILYPLLGSITSIAGMIKPELAGTLIKLLILSGNVLFKISTNTPDGLHNALDEIGPRKTPDDDEVYFWRPRFIAEGKLSSQKLPHNRVYPKVKGINKLLIDTCDIPNEKEQTSRTRLFFCPALFYYQIYAHMETDNELLHCNTRLFNYPGITRDDKVESINDLINAGIAEVYDLAKRNKWTNAELEKNLHLYGWCMGGNIALEVAKYFKQKHNVNLLTVADRSAASFDALAGKLFGEISGLPQWYVKLLAKACMYGGGEFNVDSVDAVKNANPKTIYPINLGHLPHVVEERKAHPTLHKKKQLGIGPSHPSADIAIRDGVTLIDGLEKAHIKCGTQKIFKALGVEDDPHRIYSFNPYLNGHIDHMHNLHKFFGPPNGPMNAKEYYGNIVDLVEKNPTYQCKSSRKSFPANRRR